MTTQELQEKLQRHLVYLAQDEKNQNLLLSVSDCYLQLDDSTQAQRYLDDAKKVSGLAFWDKQGLLYLATGEMTLAKEAFTEALVEEDSAVNRYNLGFCLFLSQEFSEALIVLNSSEENDPASERLKAKIFHHLQRVDEAIAVLEQLFTNEEPDAETAGSLSLLHFENRNAQKAEFYANKALELNSENYHGLLVRILLKSMRNEVTVEEIEALQAINDNDCRLWFILGTTQMHAMNLPAAQEAFEKASKIEPDFYDNWISLGWCYLLQNNIEKAEKCYQQAVELADDLADGWGGMALIHALQNDTEESQQCLEKAQWLDAECFLSSIARIILANQTEPDMAGLELQKTVPEIRTMVTEAIETLKSKSKTLH